MLASKKEVNNNDSSPPIIKEQLKKVLMYKKDGKLTLLKNLGNDMHNSYKIIMISYETGNIPQEFIKSRTIIFPSIY